MFYDGDDTWKFRFTGTKTGTWSFTTSSDDPELDGHSGSVEVAPTDPDSYGFVTNEGNKWARQKGSVGQQEVYVPQLVMLATNNDGYWHPDDVDSDAEINAMLGEFLGANSDHGFTGFHIRGGSGFWFNRDLDSTPAPVPSGDQDPDPETFEVLENFIQTVHEAGGHVHIWAWGDAGSPDETPLGLDGGIGGIVEERLMRYIAARLGPVPGWTMGYGYDLDEWVTETELHDWRNNMQSWIGWRHLLGGRPGGPNPEDGGTHSDFQSWNLGLDYSSYEDWEPTYNDYVDGQEVISGQPVFSEDRFRVINEGTGKQYTEAQTRRGLWQSTMAGGTANIWGNFDSSLFVEGIGVYDRANELKTYHTFFFGKNRFLPELQPNASITNGYALFDEAANRCVVYKEDTVTIQIDLSELDSSQSAVAVNTRGSYEEIDLGTLDPTNQTIELPHSSDWAVAIGDF